MPEKNWTDRELSEQVRAGNMDAFRHLFSTYYPSACSFAASIVKRRDMAEEVCSRLFEDIWRKRENLVISTSFKGYLFSAVRNRCINLLRSERSLGAGFVELDRSERELMDVRTAKDALNTKEMEAELRGILEGMPEQRRTAFVLSRFEQLRYREIAAVMGISERTVQNHIILALKDIEAFRSHLREYLG